MQVLEHQGEALLAGGWLGKATAKERESTQISPCTFIPTFVHLQWGIFTAQIDSEI